MVLKVRKCTKVVCIAQVDRLKPEEIRSILEKLRNAKSIKELATAEFREQMRRQFETAHLCLLRQVPEPESREIAAAFLEGDSTAALQRLVELRSGSESHQNSSAANVVDTSIDIEDTKKHFSWVYRHFIRSVLNAADSAEVCSHLLSGKAIEFILRELKSTTFTKYKRETPSKSLTIGVIVMQMAIIETISYEESLESELRKELEKNEYLEVVKLYCRERSVSCFSLSSITTLQFFIFQISLLQLKVSVRMFCSNLT